MNLHIERLKIKEFSTLNEDDLLIVGSHFRYTHGKVVNEFLDKLRQLAAAPVDEVKSK